MSSPGDASSQVSEEDREARDGETIVREAFERHGNYKYVRNIGEGAEGAAYLIQRKSPSETEPMRVVLKVSGNLEDLAYEEWRKKNRPWKLRPNYVVEIPVDTREWLQALANSTHTAKWVHIDPEPTKFDPDLTAKNVTVAYMNWLPNGALTEFEEGIRVDSSGNPIPNRLLWRILLCYLRAICATMWPESLVAGQLEEPQNEYGELSIKHQDFHTGNWVFDAFTADKTGTKEHDLLPPLVMIDFDYAKVTTKKNTDQERDQCLASMLVMSVDNLRDLAMINRKNSAGLEEEEPEKNTKIDLDLRTIFTMNDNIPHPILRLRRWMGMALKAIKERDGQYYATKLGITDGTEGDDAIRQMVRRLILEPNEDKKMT